MITGLANHEGGTLYVGVNDRGQVLGMHNDLKLFGQDDPAQAKDKLRVHFNTLVNQRLGVENYQVMNADWVQPEGKDVFVVKVSASRLPLFLDGEFYVRRGAQTVKLPCQKFFSSTSRRGGAPRCAKRATLEDRCRSTPKAGPSHPSGFDRMGECAL